MKSAANIAMLIILVSMSAFAQATKTDSSVRSSSVKLERMPESLEVHYARSALPPHFRDGATIYVLDPSKGYLVSHKRTNGQSCIVVHSD
jgi:hypothetical protein